MGKVGYLVIILIVCIGIKIDAQIDSTQKVSTVEAWDNSLVDYRCPTNDTINHYKAQTDYQYSTNTDLLSWWQKFVRWLFSLLRYGSGDLSLIGWILLLMGVAALVFIIVKLFGIPIKGLFIFSKSTKVTQLEFALNNTAIDDEELEKMLKTFVNHHAYREATRTLFLLCLKALHRNSYIRLNAFKTDREYYYEVDNQQVKSNFLNLIKQYEYVWFGKFNINEQEFLKIQTNFDQFMKDLVPNKKVS
ncbi:hypothetical protein [Carboxylicivirga taeanensis]|uniref:hypothetical protein n=1 Tax=Carboxylicivirga taeanensis TaxID=1416875 RepID=UPI003F6E0B9C